MSRALWPSMVVAWLGLPACGTQLYDAWPHAEATPGEALPIQRLTSLFDDQASACDSLCTLSLLHCKQEKRAYPSFADCMQSCPLIAELGLPGDTSGNSVQCRLTYALLAEQTLTFWFCQNASASGGLQCR